MEARWGAAMNADPGLNPVWHMATLPFRLMSSPSENSALGTYRALRRCRSLVAGKCPLARICSPRGA